MKAREGRRSPCADLEGVLIVRDRTALLGGQNRHVAPSGLVNLSRCANRDGLLAVLRCFLFYRRRIVFSIGLALLCHVTLLNFRFYTTSACISSHTHAWSQIEATSMPFKLQKCLTRGDRK